MAQKGTKYERPKRPGAKTRSVLLRLSDEEHEKAVRRAERDGRTVSGLMRYALKEYCRKREAENQDKATQ